MFLLTMTALCNEALPANVIRVSPLNVSEGSMTGASDQLLKSSED